MANRPKGYAPWNPTPEVALQLEQVQTILEEYHDYLPLTARQIFYRMVGAYGFEKTEKAYKRLSNYLVRARRAGLISFRTIRDDGTTALSAGGYDSPEEFLESLRESADSYGRDRMASQDMRVEVWCEAAGMAPQLSRVCVEYGITTYSTGGFSSVTVTHEIANRAVVNNDKPTYLLHIGDYDPSGVSLYEAMVEDAQMFTYGLSHGGRRGANIRPVRVALLPEQIEEHGIPTAPPKDSDSRSVNWYDETAQAEAMPPDLLAETLRNAIEKIIDIAVWEDTIAEETDERERIRQKLESLEWDE